MLFLPARKHFLSSSSKSCAIIVKNFLLLNAPATHAYSHSLHDSSSSPTTLLRNSYSRKKLHLSYQRAFGCSYAPYSAMPVPKPVSGANVETLEKQFIDDERLMILRKKLQEIGIDGSSFMPGRYNGLVCPSCKGGDSHEKSLSLHVTEDGGAAVWTCFRAKCGWKGATRAFAGVKSTYSTMSKTKLKQPIGTITEESLGLEPLYSEAFGGVKSTYSTKREMKINHTPRTITEESIGLEPLGSELLAYFADRMISGETLRRNAVMQKRKGDQVAIAFTYQRNGELVSCKYRDITKRFWQEADTEKIFYGLDDIKEASEVIIVEGEMDKLAMEEAGFKNCVSVPDGAPQKVSKKDRGFQYLWNCKDHFEKASRIILATDGDTPGHALAEELARRLGKERCWRVQWPRKDEITSFKDANEVLMFLGADAVRVAIEKAELYQMQNLE